MNKLCEF